MAVARITRSIMKRFPKIALLVFLFFLGVSCLVSQERPADSLKAVWADSLLPDSIRYEAGLGTFRLRMREGMEPARGFADSLLRFTRSTGRESWESNVLKFIGNTFAIEGDFPAALDFYLPSHRINRELRDSSALAVTYSNIGTVYYEIGNYSQSAEFLLEALQLSEILRDSANLSRVTNNLGNLYTKLGGTEAATALEYYTRSLEIKKRLNSRGLLANAYNNIGLVYTELEDYPRAIAYLDSSASLARETDNPIALSRAFSNMGEAYQKAGDFDQALRHLNESIKIKTELGDTDGLAYAFLYRGETYLIAGNYRRALSDCRESLRLGTENQALAVLSESCACLSKAEEALGNPSAALGYFKQAQVYRDSLLNAEKSREITRQEVSYEFEKRQLADSLAFVRAQAARELEFEQDLNRQRNTFNLILFGGLVLLLVGGLIWWNRRKNQKLQQQEKLVERLRQVDALKDQFLANTSHELRTPLNGIIGLSESLRDGAAGKLPRAVHENLNMIATSGRRLANLINDILDFSRLRHQDLTLAIRDVDLAPVVDVVLKLLQPLAADKSVRLINQVPEDVPFVRSDEDRLQQILYNLVGNAVKFTHKGKITVDAREENGYLRVSVADTGIGIEADQKDRIFESFEQGDGSVVRQYGGTGLGLSVTKKLVELHGGELSVESEPGVGSTFSFTLPVSQEQRHNLTPVPREEVLGKLSEASGESGSTESVRAKDPGRGEKILVVDDEIINRKVLVNYLSVASYQTLEASDGKEALELLSRHQDVALVLLDVMMPGMSGYQVCEAIRESRSAGELPVVLLTAKNRVSDLVEGFNAGANDYLAKPFSKNELFSRIRMHIKLNTYHLSASKFVPTEFIRYVGRSEITEVVLGDHVEREVTVLFTDIREYTGISEGMTPKQNFKFVNSYVGRMGPAIYKNDGFVNQYLGDGILALFPENGAGGLKAAIGMQQEIREYNTKRQADGYEPISVGMGIHTGPIVMGIIGDARRNDTAIIADTVNTASRLEGVSKYYGASIVISEDSLRQVPDRESYGIRLLGKARVKGKDQAVTLYECFDGDPETERKLKMDTLPDYEAAMASFQAMEFHLAADRFTAILQKNPNDRVVKHFLEKCKGYRESGVPSGDLTEIFSEK